MRAGQVTVCTPNNTCITANGDNAKLIVGVFAIVLLSVAAYYLSQID